MSTNEETMDADWDMEDDDFDRIFSSQVLRDMEMSGSKKECHEPDTYKYVNNFNRYSVAQLLHTKRDAKNIVQEYFIRDEKTFRSTKLILRDLWARTPTLSPGIIVNISGTAPDENGHIVVEREQGFLIVDPDRLVSVTSVVSMCWCERKVAFSEKFRFPLDNVDTLRGSIAHDLICQCMNKQLQKIEEIEAELKIILKHPDIIEKAYGLGLSQNELEKLGMDLVLWVLSFVAQRMLKKHPDQQWKIEAVRDIEDCYWNPEFGIKGKIDCTVKVNNKAGSSMIIPLEFKTGNPKLIGRSVARTDHLGQVYLYTLLMKSASEVPENKGILYYIREDHLVECSASMRELQSLVMARNQIILNTLMKSGTDGDFRGIPRPIGVDFDRNCRRCEYQNICAMSLKGRLVDENIGSESTSSTEKSLLDSVEYLSEKEMEFFDKWTRVINLEAGEDENSFNTKDLWLQSVSKREKEGKCIGGLKLINQSQCNFASEALITFQIPPLKRHLTAAILEKDFVVLGANNDPCIAFAYVEEITRSTITISLERLITGRHNSPDKRFSIDKVKSSSAGMMQFVYLCKLMQDTPIANSLRRKLIFKEKPNFKKIAAKDLTKAQQSVLTKYNKYQKVAIIKALTTDSILLVKGSPGCGKTTTIVGLVRMLAMQNKRILVSSYTSNALDNILLNYKKYDNNFLRIGSGGKLNHAILDENSTNTVRSKSVTVDEYAESLNSIKVVGTTLLSLKHPIFRVCKFDYCIIDEGSQALPTVIMGALMLAEKYIVFGDPNQLPSVIKSRKIKTMGTEDNIFAMFSNPEFYSNLTIQYRMNQFIMKIANDLLYGNSMQCATEGQAQVSLKISADDVKLYLMENIPNEKTRKWLCIAVSKRPERSVIFLNTEGIDAYEQCVVNTLRNVREKDITLAITKVLLKGGVSSTDIGVIAPYRGQVHLIRECLHSLNLEIEVNTVDQYQGREKDVIIISLTKSLPSTEVVEGASESILNDIRRLNVAITRAKAKVIIIGNCSTLMSYPACEKLLSLLTSNQRYSFTASDFNDNFFEL